MKAILAAVAGAMLAIATPSRATTVDLTFPSDNSLWYDGSSGFIGLPTQYLEENGQFIFEAFDNVKLSFINSLSYSFSLWNYLAKDINLAIIVNSLQVDTPVVAPCGYCGIVDISDSVAFAPIEATFGTVDLEIELLNFDFPVSGAIVFNSPGAFTLGGTPIGSLPEPTSLVLLGCGLPWLMIARRRSRRLAATG